MPQASTQAQPLPRTGRVPSRRCSLNRQSEVILNSQAAMVRKLRPQARDVNQPPNQTYRRGRAAGSCRLTFRRRTATRSRRGFYSPNSCARQRPIAVLHGGVFMARAGGAQGILSGLSELSALLEEPITRHALDLNNNAKTANQHDMLNQTHRILMQYLKLEGTFSTLAYSGIFPLENRAL
jgi:hypothetical protein